MKYNTFIMRVMMFNLFITLYPMHSFPPVYQETLKNILELTQNLHVEIDLSMIFEEAQQTGNPSAHLEKIKNFFKLQHEKMRTELQKPPLKAKL